MDEKRNLPDLMGVFMLHRLNALAIAIVTAISVVFLAIKDV